MQDVKNTEDFKVRFQGDTAILVEFDGGMKPALIQRIHAIDAAINDQKLVGVIETVPTYCTITLHIDPLVADIAAIDAMVRNVASKAHALNFLGRVWEVPVAYGGDFGCDLEEVASLADLSPSACIEMHVAAEYTVAMVGYLPGFSYLSGLSPRLATPRLAEPRARIPASSISIGGQQMAIGSLEGPSGWHLIGRTPVRPFQPGRNPEFLFEPGDQIRFRPISETEWVDQNQRAASGALVAELLQT